MNDIRKFLSGDINVVDLGDGVILSKETAKSSELWHISVDGEDKKSFWVSKKNTSAKKGDYTGGGQPYLMTMVNNIKDIRKTAIGNLQEQLGFIVLIIF